MRLFFIAVGFLIEIMYQDHMTPALHSLHWPSVCEHIHFNLTAYVDDVY